VGVIVLMLCHLQIVSRIFHDVDSVEDFRVCDKGGGGKVSALQKR
jgi:hypothetical protein